MKQQELLNSLSKLHSDTLKLVVSFAAISRDVGLISSGIQYQNVDDVERGVFGLCDSSEVLQELLSEFNESLRKSTHYLNGGVIFD